jgi:hypothetical protein
MRKIVYHPTDNTMRGHLRMEVLRVIGSSVIMLIIMIVMIMLSVIIVVLAMVLVPMIKGV